MSGAVHPTRARLDALTAAEVLDQLRGGRLDAALPPLRGRASAWSEATLARLVTTWPADHPDAVTGAEARLVLTLAHEADEVDGVIETPRTALARAAWLDGREIGDGLAWLRWRAVTRAKRISAPGAPRVDRVTLMRWRAVL